MATLRRSPPAGPVRTVVRRTGRPILRPGDARPAVRTPEPAAPRAATRGVIPITPVATNKQPVLLPIIQTVRTEYRRMRPGDYLHVSDLIRRCVRQRALAREFGFSLRPQALSLYDRYTFGMGDTVHDITKEIVAAAAPHMAWGRWSCKCGFLSHDEPCTLDETTQDEECPHCKTLVNHYHEVSIFDDELGIVGNPDLLLYFADIDAIHITEIKSISTKEFAVLKAPDPDHVLQVVFYWYLMHKAGYRLTDYASILYVDKGWQFGNKSPHLEFIVDVGREVARLDRMIQDAVAHKAHKEGSGPTPPRHLCISVDSKHAKTCDVAALCFSRPG